MVSPKTRKLITQFAKYMVGGGVWFWSGYILIVVLDDRIGLFAANLIGNAVGISLNFLVQRYWTFSTSQQEKISFTASRYVIYTLLNAFLLNYLILYALKRWFGLDTAISQFIASGFFSIWNFFWYRVWVFPESDQSTKGTAAPAKKARRRVAKA